MQACILVWFPPCPTFLFVRLLGCNKLKMKMMVLVLQHIKDEDDDSHGCNTLKMKMMILLVVTHWRWRRRWWFSRLQHIEDEDDDFLGCNTSKMKIIILSDATHRRWRWWFSWQQHIEDDDNDPLDCNTSTSSSSPCWIIAFVSNTKWVVSIALPR